MKTINGTTCPRCAGSIPSNERPGAYPGAISRWDNETEVCSNCGQEEAMTQFLAVQRGLDPIHAVHPQHGNKQWTTWTMEVE